MVEFGDYQKTTGRIVNKSQYGVDIIFENETTGVRIPCNGICQYDDKVLRIDLLGNKVYLLDKGKEYKYIISSDEISEMLSAD